MRFNGVCLSAVLCLAIAGEGLAQDRGPSSLTLQEAYLLALGRSDETGIAERGIAQAEVSRAATWLPMAPQASISASGGLQNENTIQRNGLLRAEGSVVQPLFRRGFFASREAAHLGLEAATLSVARARQQVMLEVTTAFVAVLRTRQAVLVANAAVQRAEAQEASATARVQAGGALRTAQLQATIAFRQAQVERVRAERELKLQELLFARLVGLAPPPTLTLPPTPPLPGLEQALTLSRERSDLRALQQQARAARALEESLGGMRWPRLDLKLGYDQSYTDKNSTDFAAQAIVQLTVPLFHGGEEFFRVDAQRVVADVASLRASQLDKQIAEQLRNALSELDTAQRSFTLAEQQIKDAQENYALVSNQFKLRTVTFLEVATAQSALTSAENLLLISNFDRELAAYRLLFAIGTLQL